MKSIYRCISRRYSPHPGRGNFFKSNWNWGFRFNRGKVFKLPKKREGGIFPIFWQNIHPFQYNCKGDYSGSRKFLITSESGKKNLSVKNLYVLTRMARSLIQLTPTKIFIGVSMWCLYRVASSPFHRSVYNKQCKTTGQVNTQMPEIVETLPWATLKSTHNNTTSDVCVLTWPVYCKLTYKRDLVFLCDVSILYGHPVE